MAPPLFGVEFIRRRQKRRKKARLSKMPSQPARDKGCGTQRLDTHNAACGIETRSRALIPAKNVVVSTHTMLRAALKLYAQEVLLGRSGVSTHTMLRAALKLIRFVREDAVMEVSTHTMLRAALKPLTTYTTQVNAIVSTHTMLRAALKLVNGVEGSRILVGLDTHNAACGIETP